MRPHTPRGFALIAVLWVLGLVSLLMFLSIRSSQTGLLLTRNALSTAQAESMADGLLYWAIGRLTAGDDVAIPFTIPFSPGPLYENAQARLLVQPESGLIDLNSESQTRLLGSLALQLGLEPDVATRLPALVADWRDEDNTVRPGGAERTQYLAAGHAPPANRAFRTVEEVQALSGLSLQDAQRLMPYVGVHGGGLLDMRFAPDLVRRVAAEAASDLPAGIVTDSGRSKPRRAIYRIDAEIILTDGTLFRRRAVVLTLNSPTGPRFRFLDWSRQP